MRSADQPLMDTECPFSSEWGSLLVEKEWPVPRLGESIDFETSCFTTV